MCRIGTTLLFLLFSFSELTAQNAVDTTLPHLIPYRKGILWGFCDNKREIKIQPQYYSVSSFRHNYAEVWIDTVMKGVINKTGELIMRAGKDTVLYVTEAGRVYKHFGKGVIEITEPSGNLFKPEKYLIEGSFTSTSYIAKLGEKRGVVDNNENIIIPFNYLEIGYPDKSGYTWININGRQAIIDTLGKLISPKLEKKYSIGDFRNGRAKIYKKVKYTNSIGFIDKSGKIVIPIVYRHADNFSDSISIVGNGIRYGAINLNGDTIIPFKFGYISNFEKGKASFRDGYHCGIIDKIGKEIFRTIGKRADYIYDDFIVVERADLKNKWNSLYGIMNVNGKVLLPFDFSRIYNQGDGLFFVSEKGSKDYFMDYKFNKYYED